MEIFLINRITGKTYWVSQFLRPTKVHKFALFTTSVVKVNKVVDKFIEKYKIIIIDRDGVVIKRYK